MPCQDPVSHTEDTVQYNIMTILNNHKQICTSPILPLACSTPRVSIGPLVLDEVTHKTGKLGQATVADAPEPSYQKDNRNLGSNPTTCEQYAGPGSEKTNPGAKAIEYPAYGTTHVQRGKQNHTPKQVKT